MTLHVAYQFKLFLEAILQTKVKAARKGEAEYHQSARFWKNLEKLATRYKLPWTFFSNI